MSSNTSLIGTNHLLQSIPDAVPFEQEFLALLGNEGITDQCREYFVSGAIQKLRKMMIDMNANDKQQAACHILAISDGGTLVGTDEGKGIEIKGNLERRIDALRIHEAVLKEVKLWFFEFLTADSILMNVPFWRVNVAAIAMVMKYVPHLVDAILVGHGTDTQHIGAANKAWMLQNLGKPFIIIGAFAEDGAEEQDAPQNVTGGLLACIVGAQEGVDEVMMSCSPKNKHVIRATYAQLIDGLHRGYETCLGTKPLLDWSRFTPGKSSLEELSFQEGVRHKDDNATFVPRILPSTNDRRGITNYPNLAVLDPTMMDIETMKHHIRIHPCVAVRTSHASIVSNEDAGFLYELWQAGKILCLLTETTATESPPGRYKEGSPLQATLQGGVPFGAITDVSALTKLAYALARFNVRTTNHEQYGLVVDRKTQKQVHDFMKEDIAGEWIWQA
jgi:L-asparaginase/Glu-tRNA(Gln) amidotransferase subunit D